MFVVASASLRLLYVMIILARDRRTIVSTAVTEHPTAAWLSRHALEFATDTCATLDEARKLAQFPTLRDPIIVDLAKVERVAEPS